MTEAQRQLVIEGLEDIIKVSETRPNEENIMPEWTLEFIIREARHIIEIVTRNP